MTTPDRVQVIQSVQVSYVLTQALKGNVPNTPMPHRRFVRVIPLAGAAMYPVKMVEVAANGARGRDDEVFTGPGFHDMGGSGNLAVDPQDFAAAFSLGIGQGATGTLTSPRVPAVAPIQTPNPTNLGSSTPPVPPSGAAGFCGYISGSFLLESVDTIEAAIGLGPPPQTSGGWISGYRSSLSTTAPTNTPAIQLPNYNSPNVFAIPPSGNKAAFFLGCGSRVVRTTYFDTKPGAAFPASFQKWILGPFSQTWEKAGIVTVDNSAGAGSMVVEETINIDSPLWIALQALAGADNDYAVTIEVVRQ